MGQLLDALRRIEANQATPGSKPGESHGSTASTGPQAADAKATTNPAPAAATDPRPTVIPVAPDRFGLFQPTITIERRTPATVAAAFACSPGQERQARTASRPSSPACRWWKTPPRTQAGHRDEPPANREPPLKDQAHPGFSDETRGAKSHAAPDSQPVEDPAGPSKHTPQLGADLISRLLEEYPAGRNAVVLLCDPESLDVTFAVASLAVALAERVAEPVLAIDATSRGAGLERLMVKEANADVRFRPGLSDVLSGHARWDQAAHPTKLGNVAIVPASQLRHSVLDTPTSVPREAATAAIRKLRTQYRFVLVAIGPGGDPITATLAREADAIYLVIRPGQTGRRAAQHVVSSLRRLGGRVAGCIVLSAAG